MQCRVKRHEESSRAQFVNGSRVEAYGFIVAEVKAIHAASHHAADDGGTLGGVQARPGTNAGAVGPVALAPDHSSIRKHSAKRGRLCRLIVNPEPQPLGWKTCRIAVRADEWRQAVDLAIEIKN